MKLTRKLLAAILSVCMVLALLTPAASAANLDADYSKASYYDIAVTTYSRMLLFQNGVVPAANQSKQYGLIDPTGKVVLPFQYAYVWTLGGGLFGIATKDEGGGRLSGLGIVNSDGKVVLAPSENCTDILCKNDTICVTTRVEDSSSWSGYSYQTKYYTTSMAPSTQEAYEGASAGGPLAQYDWVVQVGGYYLTVTYGDSWSGQYGVLNSKYETVIPVGKYSNVNIVTDGSSTVFVVNDQDRECAVLDTSGKTVVPFGTYTSIHEHYNGGSTLDVYSGSQQGAIGFDGKVLVPLGSYSEIGGLNADGYISAVSSDGKSSTLFKDGSAVKTYTGKQVTSEVYYRNLAFSTNGEQYGMMDMNENVIINPQYDNILSDGNGCLITRTIMKDTWSYLHGLYTQDGAQVLADKYPEISYLTDSKYKLYDGTYYGVSKVTGTSVSAVIPMKYVNMRIHTYQFIELYDGSKYSVVDLSNNVVVPDSSEPIEVFTSGMKEYTSIWEATDRLNYYGEEYDGYTKSVLPFCINTGSGYATVYADYNTGETEGQVPYRASNINDDGWFIYQDANGLYGFARTGNGFLDVAPDTWASEPVDWAVAKGVVSGRGNHIFDPDTVCTHQDIITMIWREAGRPIVATQAPVTAGSYAVDAVNWAYEQKIIDNSFVAGAECTRAQAVEYIWKFHGSPTAAVSSFTDVSPNASYAMAVNWAVEKKITQGMGGGLFAPNDGCSRAYIVTFLYRAQK